MILSFNLEDDVFEEIISQLARIGRPDLIEELKYANNINYSTATESDESDDASSEEDYAVSIDAEGFHSLK